MTNSGAFYSVRMFLPRNRVNLTVFQVSEHKNTPSRSAHKYGSSTASHVIYRQSVWLIAIRVSCYLRAMSCVRMYEWFTKSFISLMGWDSSVGIATRYGLDGPGIESRWGARFSAPIQTGPAAYPASYTTGTGSFPGVKRPGRCADHPPCLSAEVMKCRAIRLLTLRAFWVSTEG